jgi:hypothetical protein
LKEEYHYENMPVGHMMYTHSRQCKKFKRDVDEFVIKLPSIAKKTHKTRIKHS